MNNKFYGGSYEEMKSMKNKTYTVTGIIAAQQLIHNLGGKGTYTIMNDGTCLVQAK